MYFCLKFDLKILNFKLETRLNMKKIKKENRIKVLEKVQNIVIQS